MDLDLRPGEKVASKGLSVGGEASLSLELRGLFPWRSAALWTSPFTSLCLSSLGSLQEKEERRHELDMVGGAVRTWPGKGVLHRGPDQHLTSLPYLYP